MHPGTATTQFDQPRERTQQNANNDMQKLTTTTTQHHTRQMSDSRSRARRSLESHLQCACSMRRLIIFSCSCRRRVQSRRMLLPLNLRRVIKPAERNRLPRGRMESSTSETADATPNVQLSTT